MKVQNKWHKQLHNPNKVNPKMEEVNKMLGTGFDMDTVQKGTNAFNKVVAQATSGFSSAFTVYLQTQNRKGIRRWLERDYGYIWLWRR